MHELRDAIGDGFNVGGPENPVERRREQVNHPALVAFVIVSVALAGLTSFWDNIFRGKGKGN